MSIYIYWLNIKLINSLCLVVTIQHISYYGFGFCFVLFFEAEAKFVSHWFGIKTLNCFGFDFFKDDLNLSSQSQQKYSWFCLYNPRFQRHVKTLQVSSNILGAKSIIKHFHFLSQNYYDDLWYISTEDVNQIELNMIKK